MRKVLVWFVEFVIILTVIIWLDDKGYIAAIPPWVIFPGAAILFGLLVWYDRRTFGRDE
ncbi:MAG: hypothetical protein OXM59_00100 [Gammaproteobacteria bacterium]|nr:hypothetical protein [Gammaproteobacteria bacterium]